MDDSLAPAGAHVASLFTQITPYAIPGGWTPAAKEAYAQTGPIPSHLSSSVSA